MAEKVVIVAAVAANGVIGRRGELPWNMPEDLRHFRSVTDGGTLIMGRRTWESIGRPLPGRDTIVVTSTKLDVQGVQLASSLNEAIDLADGVAFVVGGAGLYAEALSMADEMQLTRLTHEFEGDTFFPDVDLAQWSPVEVETFSSGKFIRYLRPEAVFGEDAFTEPTSDELGFDVAHLNNLARWLHETTCEQVMLLDEPCTHDLPRSSGDHLLALFLLEAAAGDDASVREAFAAALVSRQGHADVRDLMDRHEGHTPAIRSALRVLAEAAQAAEGSSDHTCDGGVFDRTVCPEPCGAMHSFCATCGHRQDPCAHDGRR